MRKLFDWLLTKGTAFLAFVKTDTTLGDSH